MNTYVPFKGKRFRLGSPLRDIEIPAEEPMRWESGNVRLQPPGDSPSYRKQEFFALGQGQSGPTDSPEPPIGPPKDWPVIRKREPRAYVSEEETPPPVCIPVDFPGIEANPFKDPFDLGDSTTFSAFGVSGTLPYTYEWKINGSVVATTETLNYTVVDGDIQNKDPSGLGVIFVTLKISNACNVDGKTIEVTFNAQGTPPP